MESTFFLTCSTRWSRNPLAKRSVKRRNRVTYATTVCISVTGHATSGREKANNHRARRYWLTSYCIREERHKGSRCHPRKAGRLRRTITPFPTPLTVAVEPTADLAMLTRFKIAWITLSPTEKRKPQDCKDCTCTRREKYKLKTKYKGTANIMI